MYAYIEIIYELTASSAELTKEILGALLIRSERPVIIGEPMEIKRSAQNCILIVYGGKYISTKTENYCRQLENMPVSPLASCTGLRVLEYSHILLEVGPI